MARMSLDEVDSALTGCRFEYDEMAAVRKCFSIPDLFGSITEDEVKKAIFQ
jgi:hypothetical protein